MMDPYTARFEAELGWVAEGLIVGYDRLSELAWSQEREPDEEDSDAASTSHEDLVEALRVAREHMMTASLWLDRAKQFTPLPPRG